MINHAYIHIPFCIRKCRYCSFVSGKNLKFKDEYINALIKEIKSRYKNDKLKTLYIGGGTPSLLESYDIEKIINCFNFQKEAEITLEVNPETAEKEKFNAFKNLGINRISLGVQTFHDKLLNIIGRCHSESDILRAINTIKAAEFKNINIDLIYGLPSQTIDLLKSDIEKALHLDIQHISTYGLKIEPDSFFWDNPPSDLPDDEQQANMFLYLCKTLKENNFNHYEISNFSKQGYESNHNCAYWENKNYYGFGLNAAGYEDNIRYKNTSDFNTYINSPFKREEENILSKQEIMENEIFLALRLKEGININSFNEKFNINFEEKYKKILEKYTKLNLLLKTDGKIKLTEQGILLSNEIMSEFID